jgi:hypothetical protein
MSREAFERKVLEALETIQGQLRHLQGRAAPLPELPPPNREADLAVLRRHQRRSANGKERPC